MKKIILSLAIMASAVSGDVFDKGRSSVGVVVGAGSYGRDTYTIVGVSYDYYIMDGLSVGAGYRGWFGGDPTLNQITLASSYYIPLSQKFRPYIGGFVRETFVSNDENYESYGARGGIAIVMSANSYMSFGYAYEEYGDCTESRIRDCSSSYPELVFSLAF